MAQRNKPERILLVDHDIVCFRYASTSEFTARWSNGTITKTFRTEHAKYGIYQFIDELLSKTKCTRAILCLTGDYNFRYGVLPSYKHNRTDKERPGLLDFLKEWSRENFEVLEIRGLEADDIMGIYGSSNRELYVVASIDKDLRGVPCELYAWHRDERLSITTEEADRYWLYQVLIGDTTDGYTGCPGCGTKAAEKLLESTPPDQRWNAITAMFSAAYDKAVENQLNPKLAEKTRTSHKNTIELMDAAGGPEAYALSQARVARILRAGEYDEVKKKPVLWSPG